MAGSVTGWLESLRLGSDEAAERIWQRLFDRLCRRVYSSAQTLRINDDEDIASSTLAEFYQAVREGRFESLANRDELWRLLATMAVRKSRDFYKYESAERRGGTFKGHTVDAMQPVVDPLTAPFGPGEHTQLSDVLEEIKQAIDDEDLYKILIFKAKGLKNREIAGKMGCSLRTTQYMVRELTLRVLGFGQHGHHGPAS